MHRFLFVLLFLLGITGAHAEENMLIGLWKSDEIKTLNSMNETEGVTSEATKIFENDFFGQLIIEYREKDFRSRFIKAEDHHEVLDEYIEYQIVEETNEYLLVESIDMLLNEQNPKKLFKDGNCYYVLVSKWEFKEYFCRLDNEL